jgi:ABC-type multidrug transport system ATPase subunit
MVSARGLGKSYDGRPVLVDLDLDVARGEVLALLGPNGAGKTTAVEILATVRRPDRGTATVAGLDVVRDAARVRGVLGLTGQYAAVDDLLTGRENLELMGRLAHLPRGDVRGRARELLALFSLTDAADRRVRTYSGGMRRRLDLACGLLARPAVVVLDEPTTGLDPRSRNELWDVVRDVVAQGTTVLLTTQYLAEADALADQVVLLDAGRVVARGTPAELKRRVGTASVHVELSDGTRRALATDGSTADVRRALAEVDALAAAGGTAVAHWELAVPTLDDVFLELTGAPASGEPDPAADPTRTEVPA